MFTFYFVSGLYATTDIHFAIFFAPHQMKYRREKCMKVKFSIFGKNLS